MTTRKTLDINYNIKWFYLSNKAVCCILSVLLWRNILMMAATATETCHSTHILPCAVVRPIHTFRYCFNARLWNILRSALFLVHSECVEIFFFNVMLTVHPCIIFFFKWSQLGAHYFLVYLFQRLYMFRATTCSSSGELTVSMRHWYFSLYMGGCLVCRPDSHPAIQSEKYQCRIDTVSSPDDGHTVARIMLRIWNKYTKQ